ncbi:hypothetical protein CEP54_005253 [Fusarium duplospermum]|uniref:DUF7908 domain-containing protein n=1 Tax=Fusarium duplospermum TaxID=1325734 RepID=A0A428QDR2_9HYPO|nr:hypothetical protein CEP54_005253 [Fusarium duplospermum]
MRQLLFHLALVGNVIPAVASLEKPELVQGSLCFTYLSTYLAPVQTWAASLNPVESSAAFDRNETSTSLEGLPTVDLPDSSSLELPSLPIDGEDVPTADFSASGLSGGATVTRGASATSDAASATSGSAGVSGQGIILLVDESEQERKRQQRAIRGFINNGNTAGSESCFDAGVFSLIDGQLLEGGDPIYYAGEDFKQLTSQGGPPIDAITRTFVNSGGILLFENSLLPNGEAGYCQDPETSEVFITFASAPEGCVPVSLTVYLVEQCQNGQIIDAGTSSVSSTLSLRPTISDEFVSTDSTQLTKVTMLSSLEELPTFEVIEDSTAITPTNSESRTIPLDSSATDLESPGTVSNTDGLIEDSSSSSPRPHPTATASSTERRDMEPSSEVTAGDTSLTSSERTGNPSSSSTEQTETSLSSESGSHGPSFSFTSFDLEPSLTTSSEASSAESAQPTMTSLTSDSVSTDEMSSSLPSSEDVSVPTPASSEATSSGATSVETSASEAATSTTSEITSREDLSTSAVTTETSASDPCGGPLTTVALAQPTNIYDSSELWDDETMAVELPFEIGIQNARDSFVFVSPNGLLSLFGPSPDSDNRDLPYASLPPVSILPFWDNLYFSETWHGVSYEVYPSTLGGREVTFEWVGYSVSVVADDTFHFAITFYENFPNRLDFKYYTTGDKGNSATIGAQRRSVDDSYSSKWSFNKPDAVPDGTILRLDTQLPSGFTSGTFDNTACGKRRIEPEP